MPRVDPMLLRQQLGLNAKCSRREILEALNEKAAASQKPAISKKIMERREDPMRGVLEARPDLGQSLARLAALGPS